MEKMKVKTLFSANDGQLFFFFFYLKSHSALTLKTYKALNHLVFLEKLKVRVC